MHYSKSLSKIPVFIAGAPQGQGRRLQRRRRAFQIGVLLLAVLIPLSGLFRIDPLDGAIVVLGRQVWFADFYIVFGFWMAIASGLVVTYSTVGNAFCGWACPQNTVSEWANRMTRRLLGKRAEVNLDGAPMRVSQGKDKWLNWTVLGALFVGVSMLIGIVPLLYFYAPDMVWSFVTFRPDSRLAGSLYWIYAVFVLIILLDVAFIRHFFCRFMCIYRIWQHSFKTRQTLHVAYDPGHLEECARCNYCVTSCFLDIDPRKTETYDSCVNCGECITACERVRTGRGTGGASLLRFEVGERDHQGVMRTGLSSLMGRVQWTVPLFLLGIGLFAWGLHTYEPYHLTAYRAEMQYTSLSQVLDYRITVSNKRYQPAEMTVSVAGLPPGSYTLSRERVTFTTAGRQDVALTVHSDLPRGLYPVLVRVRSDDGWQGTFRLNHFSEGVKL